MNTKLTSTSDGREAKTRTQTSLTAPLQADYPDLRLRLVAELSHGAYECAICCGVVATKASVWSCSRCSTVLHLKCAQMWARTSLDQAQAAWRATHPGQDPSTAADGELTWRCPGCQTGNGSVPTTYTCWCGGKVNPSPSQVSHPPGAIRVPHGCGQPCPKGVCEHGCPSLCHPAACPPCPIVVTRECFCGAKTISARCSQLSSHQTGKSGISCGATCGKPLACGAHACPRPCHSGPCSGCTETFVRACFCGKHTRTMGCGEGEPIPCAAPSSVGQGLQNWDGYFACDERCLRLFACGVHACEEGCHTHGLDAGVCPRDPSRVQSCPCGASARADHRAPPAIQEAVLARTKCTDAVPTCTEPCGKELPCGHRCSATCHEGACPACQVVTTRPCRCGASTASRPCTQWSTPAASDVVDPLTGDVQPTCKVVCGTRLSCGKHSCSRPCCPLALLNPDRAQEPGSSSKRPTNAMAAIAAAERHAQLEEASAAMRALADPLGLHSCSMVCGKPLACGSHNCEQTCHRGACGRCLNASFEEVSCACGGTVLEPPVPCGTKVACRLRCHRGEPPCGHPSVAHTCHEDDVPCPPCVYLTTRRCHCGKTEMANIPCSRDQARIICGQPCDAVLNCGYHRCTGKCHAEGGAECGRCTQVCGKPRPSCGHACTLRCHAPSVCSEEEPCTAPVDLHCPCGHLRQTVPCGVSEATKGRARERTLKCSDACGVAKRNARLAEALGLPAPTGGDGGGASGSSLAPRGPKIVYPATMLDMYRARRVEGDRIEKAVRDFYALSPTAGGAGSTVLPPAKPDLREFTRMLARLYRLDARDVDRDPKRSVMLARPPSMQHGTATPLLPRPTLREALAEQTRSSASASTTFGTHVPRATPSFLAAAAVEHSGAAANAYVLDGLFGVAEDELRAALPALAKPRTQLVWLSDSRLLIARPQHADWRADAQAAVAVLARTHSPLGLNGFPRHPARVLPAKVDWSLASDTPKLCAIAPVPVTLSAPVPAPLARGTAAGTATITAAPASASLPSSLAPSRSPSPYTSPRPATGGAWSSVAKRAASAAASATAATAVPGSAAVGTSRTGTAAAAAASLHHAVRNVPDAWDA